MDVRADLHKRPRRRSAGHRLAATIMGAFWLPPMLFGGVLVLFGVLIFYQPALLSYLVASVFVLGGLTTMLLAWLMRGRVSYRRVEFLARDDA